MRLSRFLTGLALTLGGVLALGTPAQAAIGPWSTVSAGVQHTCAINAAQNLYCWGDASRGQIGDGTSGDGHTRGTPTRVGGVGVWASVSAGGQHTCGITEASNLYCWGRNDFGQVGDGTQDDRPTMKRVGGVGVWIAVSAGGFHTCGITEAKNLYCWGRNYNGEIGDGTSGNNRLALTRIGGAGVWSQVSLGDQSSCGITTADNLYCWGWNQEGQIGDGTKEDKHALTRIGGAGVWASIAPSTTYHTCGITLAKNLYCWGNNAAGQIGDGTTGTDRVVPTKVGGSGVWSAADGGIYHSCGITSARNLYCWGNNSRGQIGDGTTRTFQLAMKRVGGSGVWARLATGSEHTCGITVGKNLYCWGHNQYGQIGDGSTEGFGQVRPSLTRIGG